jgi:hypothetical protein
MTAWKFSDATQKVAFRVNPAGSMESRAAADPEVAAAIVAGQVLPADPAPPNVIPFAAFLARWTDPEYALLMQRRATAIGAGNVTLVRQWDMAMAAGIVDLGTPAASSFKAALVTATILSQARADAIFA